FQAEDGIRDFHVTGVRRVLFRSDLAPTPNVALVAEAMGSGLTKPIEIQIFLRERGRVSSLSDVIAAIDHFAGLLSVIQGRAARRSEERRVGKEGRYRRSLQRYEK